tara:strand:+ start:104 stop:661 length:558 start_codon:yes stop_codon:yes gene_type:complete
MKKYSTTTHAVRLREKYQKDPVYREKERKRNREYNKSHQGRKVKRAGYDKYMQTEHGYLTDKWHTVSKKAWDKRRKPIPVELTKEEFFELWEQHKKKYGGWICAYTGQIMTQTRSMNPVGSERGKASAIKVKTNMSVDRLDSSKGYTKDNIVFCTWEFNDRKGNVSLEDIRCILNLMESKKDECL